MRRFLALALTSAFLLLQVPTAALAAPSGMRVTPLHVELAEDLASIDLALMRVAQSSYAVALLTNSTARYNAIHAAAPVFKRNAAQLVAPNLTLVSHAVQKEAVYGSRGTVTAPSLATALQKHSDPLAMQSASAQASPAAGAAPALLHTNYMTASPSPVSGTAGGYQNETLECFRWDNVDNDYDESACNATSTTTTNAAVATASDTGEISFVGAGTATVTFTATGIVRAASVSVTVTGATPTPSPTATPTPTAPPTATPSPSPTGLPTAVTGINRWWSYQTDAIPGVGRVFENVGTGNMIVQNNILDVPERGIDLALRLSYNSLSRHDVNNSDGSVPSNYGNGWTSETDAHMAYNAATNTMSVYDVDGARYDFASSGGSWTPPPGIHSSLAYDGACGYTWTKRGDVASPGTVYYFYAPIGGSCVTNPGNGYRGRLQAIYARNHNDELTFEYSFSNGDASNPNNIAQLVVQHSDGQAMTLTFADFSGHRLLSSVTRPDGASATFGYDANGDLTDIYEIGNNAATGATPIHHEFAYAAAGTDGENGSASSYMMQYADGANWVMSGGTSGAYVAFQYDGNNGNAISQIQYEGVVDPVPADGTGTQLQSGYTSGPMVYRTEWLAFSGGETEFSDSDGHATIYQWDGSYRITETQDWNGSIWLVNNATWDSDNNVTAAVDERGNETDYAYDSDGNAIVESLPSVSTTSGTLRPTSVFAYDSFDNLTAACDANWAATNGISGTGSASSDETACANAGGGTQRYIYNTSDGSEPFGYLTESKSACVGGSCADAGIDETYTYNQSIEGGDYGLPTSVTQPCFTQYDSSQVCPQQSFAYGPTGNLTSYDKGNGAWALAYDTDNRLTSATDPDGVTTRTCYFEDGSVQATQSPTQYANDNGVVCGSNSTSYTYDDDGNKLTELHHFNNEAGTTTNIYDGDDRLVEVILPHDAANDYYSYAWMTRNIYDLSQGGTVSIGSQSGIYAHGNLYKTQEYGSSGWFDLKGTAYDPMDRVVNAYSYESVSDILEHTTNAYDQSTATYGLLATATDAVGEVTTPTYDADGKTVETQFSNDGGVTPSETLTFDPDGRVRTITSSTMGTQSTAYDADGKVTAVQEASGGSVTSPANYTYTYYADGQRAGLSVSSSTLTQSNMLQYAYRTDGLRTKLAFAYGANSASWTWGRSDAGRATSIADSSGQPTRTITYDAEGRTATDTMPSGESSNFTYDDEGEVLSYNTPNNDGSTATTISYTIRGEFASQTFAGGQCGGAGADTTLNPVETKYANGVSIGESCDTGTPTSPQWDVRTGAIELSGGGSNTTDYLYDASGRQTHSDNTWSVEWGCHQDGCQTDGADGLRDRSYDAQNHLISDVISQFSQSALSGCIADRVDPPHDQINGVSGTQTYAWGPNGHPDRWVSGTTASSELTLHWDGDTPLFITDANGTLQEIKIESIGFYAPSASTPMTFVDRDQTGFVVASHTSSSPGQWTAANPFHQTCDGAAFSGYALTEPGPDGISDGINTIQGVRSYDPAMGTWTTPDAYAGDASDPMSKKSYMWDRNNAFAYSDPSGYETLSQENEDEVPLSPEMQEHIEAMEQPVVDELEKVPTANLKAALRNPNLSGKVRSLVQRALAEKIPNMKGSTLGRSGARFSASTRSTGMPEGATCAYCGDEATEADHVVPRSQGGGNDLSNLNPACLYCNRSKQGLTPYQWLQRIIQKFVP